MVNNFSPLTLHKRGRFIFDIFFIPRDENVLKISFYLSPRKNPWAALHHSLAPLIRTTGCTTVNDVAGATPDELSREANITGQSFCDDKLFVPLTFPAKK
jgi:hypothetical protein